MEENKEVSTIQDEDVLRRMWQATEDFSRKKEIRAHMYKLREARLKEFYTSGEVLKDVQRSNSSPGLRDQPCAKSEGPTHADSLADHSFLSLKTKEIRDSESPTRDVQYRNSKNRDTDGQWTITSATTKSDDGKRITSSQLATTQGVRDISGGKLSYAAANEHQASVFADGDADNFTRSVGESSKTFAEQNVVAGDENNFRSSKTTSSSTSSKVVTHHSSTSGDVGDFEQLALCGRDEIDDGRRVTKVIYTSDTPEERFTNEKSSKVVKTSSSKSSNVVNDAKSSRNVTKMVYSSEIPQDVQSQQIQDGTSTTTVTRTKYTSGDLPQDLQKSIADGNTKVYTETKTLPDGSTVTTTRYETKGSKKFSSSTGSTQVSSNRQTVEQKSSTDQRVNKQIEYTITPEDNSTRTVVTTKTIRETYDDEAPTENIRIIKSRDDSSRPTNRSNIHTTENVRIIKSQDADVKINKVNVENKVVRETEDVREVTEQDRKVNQDIRDVKVTRTIEDHIPDTKEIHTTVTTTKTVKSNLTEPRSPTKPKPDESTRPQERPQERSQHQDRPQQQQRPQHQERPQPQEMVKSCKPEESYKPSSPTEGQYSTTYNSEFTNKRISVDVSATHDAFARSLRSISPDRIGDRPKSRGSVRTSTSSLRSSTSPEKHPRMSPERKPSYDRRSPDKYSEKRHNTSPSRVTQSPERKPSRPDTITITKTTERKIKSPEKQSYSPVRTPSPTKPSSPTKTDVTITRTTNITRTKPERSSPARSPTKDVPVNTDTITKKKKIPEDERKSPVRSPTKESTPVNNVTTPRKKQVPEYERKSPVRSPTKVTTTEITTVNTDTITRKKKVPEDERTTIVTETINTDTITRKKKPQTSEEPEDRSPTKPSTKTTETIVTETVTNRKPTEIDETEIITSVVRDLSSTSLASDIEFINHNRHIVTDLDEPCEVPEKRPSTLEITETTTTVKKNSSKPKESPRQKSPSKSPGKTSPVKEVPKKFKPTAPELDSPSERPPSTFTVPDDFEQVCEVVPKEKPPLKRTETYEERCRQMLGLPEPEQDKIPKKEYVDLYAGKEPVEEPLFTKKHVAPLGPDDELIQKNVQKLNKRRPEFTDDDIETNIEDFIVTERRDNVETVRKPNDKSPTKIAKSPERKSPEKQPQKKTPDDGEYNTEYTDEYCDKPIPEKPLNKKPSDFKLPSDVNNKKQTPKVSSPERKSPMRKQPKETTEGEYNTEYTDEYCERPEKPVGQKVIPKSTPVDKKSIPDKKVGRQSPDRKPQQPKQLKKRPDDAEYSTEYTDEYCETTNTTVRRPAGKKNEPPKTNDISPVRGIPSSPKKKPQPKNKPADSEESTDEEESITERKNEINRQSPNRGLPENVTVTQYINEYYDTPEKPTRPEDFINKEKYDTDITLEVTKRTRESPERQPKSPTKLVDIQFNLDNENTQETHIRTHRIDTTIDTSTKRETSPRRQPQRAVPSDTIECTFKKITTTEEKTKKSEPKQKTQKPASPEDRKSPVKQLNRKDSTTKTVATKTITKKTSSTDIDTKRNVESPKKRVPTEKVPKEKSPERYGRPKQRSPSPTNKTITKKTVETERNVQVTRKTSSKDISVKKTPEKVPSKPISRTPSESPVRKPISTSPERKPLKPTKTTPQKPTEPSSKHIVTKTISLTNRPEPKQTVKTTVKTTKVTQPTSVTVTTVKTTKTTKKTIKPDIDSSDESETEIVDVSDRKKVVTTAKIKVNNVTRRPSVEMPYIKVNTATTDNKPSPVTKKDHLTCITTKSIVLNQNDIKDLEFVIDLQRSTSSREPSPDKICPIPVSSEDEGSYPRYPDQVSEPDDLPSRRKPVKIVDIPLTEEEDVKECNRITEVNEEVRRPSRKITDVDKVTETDESLLSVTEKVSRFITTAEKLTEDEPKSKTPAPKVPRPELVVDETLEDDECLLSVSDKVTKFISTAEQVSTKSTKSNQRPKSPRPRERTPVDDKVNENDECLLSVNEKVSHFIQAAETVKQTPSTGKGPAPKVTRPEFTVDETLRTDECLLSVSDKVNKFLTTAEKIKSDVKTSKTEVTIKREPSPEKIAPRREYTPERISPRRESPEKVTRTEIRREYTPERISPRRESPEKITRTEIRRELSPEKSRQSPIRKTPELVRKSPESQQQTRPKSEPTKPVEAKPVGLKSSEAVKKAKAMFENISKTQDIPKQRDILSRPSIWEGRKKPEKPDEDDVKLTDIGVYKKKEPEVKKQLTYTTEDNTCSRISTNLKDVTLKSTKLILNERNLDKSRYLSPEKEIPGYMKPIQRSRSPNPNGETPGYMRPIHKSPEIEEHEPIHRSRSPNTNGDIPGYMRPIPKVSPEERDKYIIETRIRETLTPERERDTLIQKKTIEKEEIETHKVRQYENGDIPHYMLPLQRNISPEREAKKVVEEIEITETFTEKIPEREVPGYMKPLQRHTHSPEKEDRRPSEDITDDGPRSGKKFGVTLRRTDSGRVITSTTSTTVTERRRSSTPGQPVIEDIEDLEVLERMMDKVVGYEQRRRIRAQIRVVKKLISENKIQKRPKTAPSPMRDTQISKCETPIQDRRSPMRSSVSPVKKSPETRQKSSTIDSKTSFSTVTTTTSQKSERITSRSSKERSVSPDPKKRPQASMYKPDLKHVQPSSKALQEDKPSWVTNRNLKKTTTETVTEKRVVAPVKKVETVRRSPSPQKDAKPTDCITSSYGIGPTDENGKPLFGIRALRKAAVDTSKVHVRGTVVTSQFYSENGQEPVGEVTVTKYSNNPRELNVDNEEINKSKGIASVTTTQKFGTRGTPTISSIIDKKKAITDKHSEEDEIFKTTSNKVTRRGSVKALSQKFIENAVEIARNEKQVYPKAGLILRTGSFKESNQSPVENTSSRESSPGVQSRSEKISLESITSDSRNSRQQNVQDSTTKTFLNSHTRVSNAQEVISRMKNAEKEQIEGDSIEDREARMLLNKFLGAQVLMSGMEPLLSKSTTVSTTSTSSASAHLVRKVQKTKTTTSTSTKETSKPLSLTKRFQTPITAEVLQDIWDEQTLRALLEQCTDYEERRAIRARLRQVMAEQEAVANVVASAVSESQDRNSSTMQERVESKKTITEGPISTTQVSTTRVIQQSRQVSKPISPFAKFRQLDKQNSLNTPPSSPRTPTGTGAPLFKFTDPALSHSASTVKERLLQWCQIKTKEYQNIKLENFSTSWTDGLAFCALIHHFLPDAFDYHALNPKQRRHNFTLAFTVADEQAGIYPLLDVDDMVAMRRPDWKCVFTYVQSIYRRFKDED